VNHPSHAQPAAFTLPAPVGEFLGRLPAWPGSLLFVTALNLALARQLPGDVGHALQDRRLRIHVRDAQLAFDFAWTGSRFAPRARADQPDLTISASARDFLALARREQDPDTLFFSRRLAMEGDTELGLMVKNALDAMELPVFDPRQFRPPHPRAVLERLLQRRGTR
jgi:predicted lipid carrier protein YhbT